MAASTAALHGVLRPARRGAAEPAERPRHWACHPQAGIRLWWPGFGPSSGLSSLPAPRNPFWGPLLLSPGLWTRVHAPATSGEVSPAVLSSGKTLLMEGSLCP